MRLKRPRQNNCSGSVTLLMVSVMLIFSCLVFGGETELQAAVSPADKIAGDESPELTPERSEKAKKVSAEFTYNPKGKRNPFKPFIHKVVEVGSKRTSGRLPPLQELKLTQLTLIGIVWGGDINMAMVEDPARMGYVLKRGTRVGSNNGRVVRILSDRVIIEEKYRNRFGKVKSRTISLELYPDTEGEAR